MVSASIIIPTLNAGGTIGPLIDQLKKQTIQLEKILIIDSSSDDETVAIAQKHGASTIVIDRNNFDHGGTRNQAFLATISEFVLFMTQDAVPVDQNYVENILEVFKNRNVALASGRQIAKKDAQRYEQLVREFNYGPNSFVRTKNDIPQFGIKTFFASDVCSAYRRSAYLSCGGFSYPCNTNEDMLMAAKFILSGFSVAYVANAKVFHSHNLSFFQQFRRNREISLFLVQHATELAGASEYGEGRRLAIHIFKTLIKERRFTEICGFFVDCIARILGNFAGKFLASVRLTRN
ncbi:glycosyltransferase family 2 protein [Bifidobacterium mongoliense]|uniref:Glycosyl transferase family 2 n=1 Tax=Bifidobacterium mongoliense DSM 21395 TaxID=1437603 RepID=A0A087BZN8_9BIFI|nr:glycosyltransferase family 2 protein [Bifidobacterium mongoliense]KFI76488.1 glycosyl transferase family 2 [Bifidobacterium mongoliense DSM 21395]